MTYVAYCRVGRRCFAAWPFVTDLVTEGASEYVPNFQLGRDPDLLHGVSVSTLKATNWDPTPRYSSG